MQPKTLTRRRHSDDLKAQVLRECSEPGASIAAIAMAHGLNAIPFKVLPFSPVVLRDRQEKRDVVRGTGSV